MDNLAVMASSYLTKQNTKQAFVFDRYGAARKGVLFLFG